MGGRADGRELGRLVVVLLHEIGAGAGTGTGAGAGAGARTANQGQEKEQKQEHSDLIQQYSVACEEVATVARDF